MDQFVFNEDGDILIEKVERVTDDAPDFVKDAWRKAKQDRIREFKKKQDLSYDEKLERQAKIAWSYYEQLQGMKLNAHVSVGGLDSITLYIWLLSIGIDVSAVSVNRTMDRRKTTSEQLPRCGRHTLEHLLQHLM